MEQGDKKYRIGILLRNRHDGPGGLERVLEIVVKGIQQYPVDFYIYALYPPKYSTFTKDFPRLTTLKVPYYLDWLERKLPQSISRLIRKSYVQLNGEALFEQIILDQIDVLIVMDLSKQFLSNYSFLKKLKEKSGIPLVSWVHSSLSSNTSDIEKDVRDKIGIFDGHLAISSGIAKEIEEDYGGKNIATIYNPVEEVPLITRDKSKFIYIGRIDENKRVHSLLTHLSPLKGEWCLDIYGSTGNNRGDREFQSYIDSLNLSDKVIFHGWKHDVWADIDSAGVVLLNSRREGFPLVLVEAMMRGIPALSSDCPTGPADIIAPGENGWLYPVADESLITEILQRILDGKVILPDPVKVKESVSKYRFEVYFETLFSFLQKVIAENSLKSKKDIKSE